VRLSARSPEELRASSLLQYRRTRQQGILARRCTATKIRA
jgi:hypothetical protein